mgnify:CR=1 FL=1
MDTKRNQTLEEIEENKIVNEHYQNRIMLIKKLLKTSRLATVDLCVHIDISEASYYRYINFTSYMKADISYMLVSSSSNILKVTTFLIPKKKNGL